MFSRDVGEGSFVNKDNYNSAQSSLLTYISRNTVTFSFVLSVIYYKKRKNVILLCLQLIALLITCSPIGMPRFQAATVYIGILILLFPKLTKKRYFIIFFVLAFVFLFPFINAFRYDSALDSNVTQIFKDSSNNIISNLTDANFDAYVMLMKTQKYVEANGISLGNQLLGAILFFVPRSIWPNKAYGSGYTIQVAEGSYGAEANVSCPLIAEGYINFGIIGIALFAVVFGWLIKKFDNWFYYSKGSINNEAKKVVYTFIPMIIFFMMRGDLMSTTSFIMSYIIVGYIIVHYALRERKTDLKNIKRKANVNGNIRF